MKRTLFCLLAFAFCAMAFQTGNKKNLPAVTIGEGQVPDVAKGMNGVLHVAFGKGDSILYSFSADKGKSFTAPQLVGRMTKLFSFAMRGPQIVATAKGVCILACDQQGNIFSYRKTAEGIWKKGAQVNDVVNTAKEGLIAIDGNEKGELFAVWLDVRSKGNNNIYGARSADGGQTWSKNKMIYTSPDGHVCECCKPSVVVAGKRVTAMFRNWLNGDRDLYLIQSTDGGETFQAAQKLGLGNWQLKGCPMDGGGLIMGSDGSPQTVWRREGKIFAADLGKPEREIGEGKSCTIEIVNGKTIYAWVEKGDVMILKPDGNKINLGKGQLPVLKAVSKNSVACIWEQDKSIHTSVVTL